MFLFLLSPNSFSPTSVGRFCWHFSTWRGFWKCCYANFVWQCLLMKIGLRNFTVNIWHLIATFEAPLFPTQKKTIKSKITAIINDYQPICSSNLTEFSYVRNFFRGGMLAWLCVWVKVHICIWLSWCHCHLLSLAPVYLPGFIGL